jgi:hypothetical protein
MVVSPRLSFLMTLRNSIEEIFPVLLESVCLKRSTMLFLPARMNCFSFSKTSLEYTPLRYPSPPLIKAFAVMVLRRVELYILLPSRLFFGETRALEDEEKERLLLCGGRFRFLELVRIKITVDLSESQGFSSKCKLIPDSFDLVYRESLGNQRFDSFAEFFESYLAKLDFRVVMRSTSSQEVFED